MATPTSSSATAAESLDPALASLVADNKYIINIIEHGPYGYTPSLYLPIAFAALYGLSAMLHCAQMASTRHWYMSLLVFGCVAEAAGNNIRIWGHYKPRDITPYIAQQVILVVTPAFFAAVHYWVLGRILALFGCGFTLASISPKNITPLFVVLDVASLGIQAAGSALAAIAEIDSKDTTSGGNIVVIGLCVQLAAYFCFNLLLLSFMWKAAFSSTTNNNPYWTRRFKWFLLGLFLASVLVLCRSVFRTIEMIGGWVGPISTVEWYYFAFDAAPVCASVILLNLFHPGYVLPDNHREAVQEGCIRRNEVDGASAKANGKQKESKKAKGNKGTRPRSSFLVGGPADMNNVSVLSSGRDNLHRTQPHFRTGSLASTSIDKDGYSPDTDKGSFGWSQPQSPDAVAYAQFRARTHPTIADHFAENAMMSMDGFEPVDASSRGFKEDDEDDSSVMMMMSTMKSTSTDKLKDARSLTPSVYSQPSRGASMATPLPEVQVWRDSGIGETTPIRSSTLDPRGSSSDWTISAASPTSPANTERGPSQDVASVGTPRGGRSYPPEEAGLTLHSQSSPTDAPYQQGYAVQPQQPDYRANGSHSAASTSVQMMQASPSSSSVYPAALPNDTPSRQFRQEAAAAAAFASTPATPFASPSPARRQDDQPYRNPEASSVLSIGEDDRSTPHGHTQLAVEPLRFHQQQQAPSMNAAGSGAPASRDQRQSNVSEYAYAL